MNLVPVTPPREGQRLLCCRCNHWAPIANMLADLNGKPFIDYYCKTCAEEAA